MNRKNKTWISLFLCALLCLNLFSVSAEEITDEEKEELKEQYDLEEETLGIIGGADGPTVIEIVEENGKKWQLTLEEWGEDLKNGVDHFIDFIQSGGEKLLDLFTKWQSEMKDRSLSEIQDMLDKLGRNEKAEDLTKEERKELYKDYFARLLEDTLNDWGLSVKDENAEEKIALLIQETVSAWLEDLEEGKEETRAFILEVDHSFYQYLLKTLHQEGNAEDLTEEEKVTLFKDYCQYILEEVEKALPQTKAPVSAEEETAL